MELSHWLTLAALCTTGAMTPGPSLVVVIDGTLRGGRGEGVRIAVGHGIGVGLYAFGAVAGFSALVTTLPGLHAAVSGAGALFLLWMGVQSWRSAAAPASSETSGAHADGRPGFWSGFAIAFLNPKIAVFFLALLGSFVPDGAGLATRVGVAVLAWSIDTAWYVVAALVLTGTGGAAWLAERRRWVARVSALVLVAAAGLVIAEIVGSL